MSNFDFDDDWNQQDVTLPSGIPRQEKRTQKPNARWTPPVYSVPELLASCEPAPEDHPFLLPLRLTRAHGHVYHGEPIAGVECDGCFMDLICDTQKQAVNIFIVAPTEEGSFKYLYVPGAPLAGCFTQVGERTSKLVVVADYLSGLAIHEATGFGVAVCHYNENLGPVCRSLKLLYPGAEVVVAAGVRRPKDVRIVREILADASSGLGVPVAALETCENFYQLRLEKGNAAVRASVLNARNYEPEPDVVVGSSEDDAGAEHADQRPATAWSMSVHPAGLIAGLCAHIGRHTALPFHSICAIALWALATHFVALFSVAPILALISLTRRCGKSITIDAFHRFAWRPELSSDITPATLFRLCAKKVTMFLDEADQYLRRAGNQLVVVLNAGHSRIAPKVMRVIGGKEQSFTAFGFKCIAAIEDLPPTVMDRAIVITLVRKLVTEKVDSYTPSENDDVGALRAQIEAFTFDYWDQMKATKPRTLNLSNDRAAQNWGPLLAVASCAGSAWIKNAAEAAVALTPSDDEVPSVLEEFIRDLATVFRKSGAPYISSLNIVSALNADPAMQWATYSNGGPMRIHDFSRLMKRLKLKSTQKQISKGKNIHVVYQADVADLFARYTNSHQS
jgi:putative DNA primase/helicase